MQAFHSKGVTQIRKIHRADMLSPDALSFALSSQEWAAIQQSMETFIDGASGQPLLISASRSRERLALLGA